MGVIQREHDSRRPGELLNKARHTGRIVAFGGLLVERVELELVGVVQRVDLFALLGNGLLEALLSKVPSGSRRFRNVNRCGCHAFATGFCRTSRLPDAK